MMRCFAVAVMVWASTTWACPTCSCGNPTITTMGLDQPFANRFRIGLSTRAWQTSQPSQTVRELRADLSLSFAPTNWLQFFVTMPTHARELQSASLERQRAFGPGELDLAARFVVLREQRMRARYLISINTGLQIPTSPIVKDANGVPLDIDAQLGLGAWAPYVSLNDLSFLSEKWAVFGSVIGELAFGGRLGVRGAPSIRGLLGVQWQPPLWLAACAGVEGRYDVARTVNGAIDLAGAGPSIFAAPDVLFMIDNRWVLQAGLRVPIASALGEGVRPGPIFALTVVVDV